MINIKHLVLTVTLVVSFSVNAETEQKYICIDSKSEPATVFGLNILSENGLGYAKVYNAPTNKDFFSGSFITYYKSSNIPRNSSTGIEGVAYTTRNINAPEIKQAKLLSIYFYSNTDGSLLPEKGMYAQKFNSDGENIQQTGSYTCIPKEIADSM